MTEFNFQCMFEKFEPPSGFKRDAFLGNSLANACPKLDDNTTKRNTVKAKPNIQGPKPKVASKSEAFGSKSIQGSKSFAVASESTASKSKDVASKPSIQGSKLTAVASKSIAVASKSTALASKSTALASKSSAIVTQSKAVVSKRSASFGDKLAAKKAVSFSLETIQIDAHSKVYKMVHIYTYSRFVKALVLSPPLFLPSFPSSSNF
ncbi:unnamed protein product [Owenia fusiformis]|uniref:Uncharacterized protein n=1 Tax=Owenia fusiformis TaxID=6347 RepID=A0A8J1TI68_OWEFU|nr:unnamed protein product [Owenia fusiformis]